MTLQTSGSMTLEQIQTEFGGPTPVVLENYYNGGSYVPSSSANANIPTSGAITFPTDFYGASATTETLTITGGGSVENGDTSWVFDLSANSTETPSAYSWSTTAGTLSSTTIQSPTLTLGETTATVTCHATVSGTIYTESTTCTFVHT